MPSPAMATIFPCCCSWWTISDFLRRQNFGFEFLESRLPGNGLGRGPVVAGNHDHTDSLRPKVAESWRGRSLNRIRNGNVAGISSVDRDKNDVCPPPETLRLRRPGWEMHLLRAEAQRFLSATCLPSTCPVIPFPGVMELGGFY